ncbi:MAG: hypothetical protein WCI73_11555, partial [Phycisphaerae bacterium]
RLLVFSNYAYRRLFTSRGTLRMPCEVRIAELKRAAERSRTVWLSSDHDLASYLSENRQSQREKNPQ